MSEVVRRLVEMDERVRRARAAVAIRLTCHRCADGVMCDCEARLDEYRDALLAADRADPMVWRPAA